MVALLHEAEAGWPGALGPGTVPRLTAEHLHVGRTTHAVEVRVHRGPRLVANLLVTQLVLAPREA